MKIREPQKAKYYCHRFQSLHGLRTWATPPLDCLLDPNHPIEGDLYTVTLLREENMCDRGRVNSWKSGPGGKKEWRSMSRYLTSKRKRKGAGFSVMRLERASKFPSKAAGVHLGTKKAPWQIAIPRDMLMQRSTCSWSPSPPKPRSSMQLVRKLEFRLKYTHQTRFWDNNNFLPLKFPVSSTLGGSSNLEDEVTDDREPSR